jgi:hypothetical protein
MERIRAQNPPEVPQKPVERHVPAKPVVTLPCRLVFPAKPPADIRNAMKDDGWLYDKLANVWTAEEQELLDIWLDELVQDWQARIISPPRERPIALVRPVNERRHYRPQASRKSRPG